MSDARTRQDRQRSKRHRREKRRAQRDGLRPAEQASVQLVVSPEGVTPDLDRAAELHATRMSDTLVELMKPYIPWPPAPDEIEELEDWMSLGAGVWNIVEEARDAAACTQALTELAAQLDGDDVLELVEAIARRKMVMFPRDRRRIAAVRVVHENGRATVEAMSFGYVPPARP
jgi:hypothetical protein